jgi:hypothetical protein
MESAHALSRQLESNFALAQIDAGARRVLSLAHPSEDRLLRAVIDRWDAVVSASRRDPLVDGQALCHSYAYRAVVAAEWSRRGRHLSNAELSMLDFPQECLEQRTALEWAYPAVFGFIEPGGCDGRNTAFDATWATDLVSLRAAEACGDSSRAQHFRQAIVDRGIRKVETLAGILAAKAILFVAGMLVVLRWLVRWRLPPPIRGIVELKSAEPRLGIGIFAYSQILRVIVSAALVATWLSLREYSVTWAQAVPEITGLLVLIALVRRWDHRRWRWWFEEDAPFGPKSLMWALALFTCVTAGDQLVAFAMPREPIVIVGEWAARGIEGALVASVVAVVVAPMLEELGFRGLLFSAVRSWLNAPVAIVLSACIFAAAHVGYEGPEVALVLWFGVAMALGYELSGSVWPLVICHAIYNAGQVLAPWAW